nr:beta-1,3-galactosyltransferase 7 isoform X3 [Tanacetum cinerariifolium]
MNPNTGNSERKTCGRVDSGLLLISSGCEKKGYKFGITGYFSNRIYNMFIDEAWDIEDMRSCFNGIYATSNMFEVQTTYSSTLDRDRSKPRVYIGCMKSGPVLSQKSVWYHEPEY